MSLLTQFQTVENKIELATELTTSIMTGAKYIVYDRITSDGNQAIDTGVVGGNTVNVELDCQPLAWKNNTALFGACPGGFANRYAVFLYNASASDHVYYYYGTNTFNNTSWRTEYQNRNVWKTVNNVLYINNVARVSNGAQTFNTGGSLYIFASHNGSSASWRCKMDFYSCKIYKSSVLVRDYVPVKEISTSRLGLYDKVNKVFYPSIVTVEGHPFVAGTEVGRI